ncbi:PNPLA domain-containing protein [Fusarium sp. Ph1]|nr:PNPLA domain-containing protein [Fusarium sp. Ph1]
MIGGTSTGGLIAIMLGRLKMSVVDCIEAYQHISRQVFRPTFCSKYMHRVMRTITGRPMYHSQHLEDAVKDIIQACGEAPNAPLETADDGRCKVFVCATQLLDRSQVQFCSYRDPVPHNRVEGIKIWEAARRDSPYLDPPMSCHIIYSFCPRVISATPTYFEPIKVGSHSLEFVDGGIGANNPVFETRNCARDLWQASSNTSFDEQIHCLVSIGAGVGRGYSAKGLDMRNDFSPFLTDTEATASRLTVPTGIGSIDLADTSKPEDVAGWTFTYLEEDCKRIHSKRSRIDLDASKTAGYGSGCRWIVLCLTIVVLIIGMTFVNSDPPPIDRSAPAIVLMGQTGAGKSAFIAKLGGQHVSTGDIPGVGHGLKSTSINGRNVYLIDTPGFDDGVSDFQILNRMSKELHNDYRNGRLLNGTIYLYDISRTRIGGSGVRQLDYFKLMVGDEAFSNCALVTTGWDLDSPSDRDRQQDREKQLKQDYWTDMISGGSTVMRHDGSLHSAKQIISSLIDKPKIVLHHQHERGKENKSFRQTRAGIKAAEIEAAGIKVTGDDGRSEPGPGLWYTVHHWIWALRLKLTHPVEYWLPNNMARTIYLIVYNSRLFPAHWVIWIPSQSDPDIDKIINAAGDVLTGFDITFERNYNITAESRPHQVISLGQVEDGDVIDVPGDGSHRVESESQGDPVAWDPIEEAGLSTPAPVKSLRPVSTSSHSRVELRNCQTWVREVVEKLVQGGIMHESALESVRNAPKN